jgi:hypothetical protein
MENPLNLSDPFGLQTVPGTASARAYWFQFGPLPMEAFDLSGQPKYI